ncbi:MAG: tetratricopeptide repeat protein [Planctomycetes bacterium]|nr:tetratricopeptide repeat protein [Planctomycetota bacterium]
MDPLSASSGDPVEELLARCLAADEPARALRELAVRHPEHAAELEARFALLRRAGLAEGEAGLERLGRFRLLRELGGGGMGTVHLAEEEPLGRRVALKRIRPELLHFGGARQRFLREISAVAALQHPGIVPIYSYGEEAGVPYYAMELVSGRSLAEIVAEQRSGSRPDAAVLRQRSADWVEASFEIGLQLAEALAHAHERGIVHRDVKPSNAMLADDGRALLIDFGLARAVGDASLTRTGTQPGSLAYMSPEQVRGEEVDPRTDVWSLGATLFELATLRSPFAAETEEATRQRILEGKVPDMRRSGSHVAWDCAVVLATALAPERERRYVSMRELADDLRAILEHRPIRARRASAWLRLRRYAQRRPAVVTGASLGLLLITALPSALLWKERSTRIAVQREAETARAAVRFLEDLFAECEPERARGATVTARAILDRGVARILEDLGSEPAVKASLLEAMGSAYLNLGLFAEAAPLLEDALRAREGTGAPASELDRVLRLRARLAGAQGDAARAEALWRQVLAALPPLESADGVDAAEVSVELAHALWRQDRTAQAEALLEDAVGALRRLLPAGDARVGKGLLAEGLFLQERDDPLRAEPLLTEAESVLSAALPADHPTVVAVRCDRARNARIVGRLDLAASSLAVAERDALRLFDAQHPQLARVREELALLALAQDEPRAAAVHVEAALAAFRVIHPAPHHVLARALNAQSSIAAACGELAVAESAAREALAQYEQIFPSGHLDRAAALCNLAMILNEVGHPAEAVRIARESLAMQERLGQRSAATRAMTLAHLGYALAFQGELAEAEQHAREASSIVQATRVEPLVHFRTCCLFGEVLCIARKGGEAVTEARTLLAAHPDVAPVLRSWALYVLGWGLEVQGELPGAESALREALEIRRTRYGEEHPIYGLALQELGVVLARSARPAEAEGPLAQAVAIRRSHGGTQDAHLSLPLLNLATVRFLLGRRAEAASGAEECLANLRGKVRPGNFLARTAVLLLLKIGKDLPDLEERRARLAELVRLGEEFLGPDDPGREQIAEALRAAGG